MKSALLFFVAFVSFITLSGGLSNYIAGRPAPVSAVFLCPVTGIPNFGVAVGYTTPAQAGKTDAGMQYDLREPRSRVGIISLKHIAMKKKTRKGAAARTPAYLRNAIENKTHDVLMMAPLLLPLGTVARFNQLAAQDGMTLPQAVSFLINWAVSQNSLCPMTKAEDLLAVDLRTIHADLTRALNRVSVPVANASDDDEDDTAGEEWKKGGTV